MAGERTLKAFREYMECRVREELALRGSDRASAPFITISRQTGAWGLTIAEEIVRFLNDRSGPQGCPWVLMDKQLTAQVIAEHGLPEKLERYLGERHVSELSDLLDEVLGTRPPTLVLVRRTSETILRLARAGHVVLVGRGAHLVTAKLRGGYHVRLIGSMALRRRHVMDHYGYDAERAEAFIRQEDDGRADYVKRNFSVDINDPLRYDLVLNTDRTPAAEAARIIAEAALRRAGAEG